MGHQVFERGVDLPVPREEAFAWHGREGAFERLVPPFEPVAVRARTGQGIDAGATVELVTGKPPLALSWLARHTVCEPPARFEDVQERGPFAHWHHQHIFEEAGPGRSRLVDRVEYALPVAPLGGFFAGSFVRQKLERMFAWRHSTTVFDLLAHQRAARHLQSRGQSTMRILITGASGLVGSNLSAFLTTGGHTVAPLSRSGGRGPTWDPAAGTIDRAALEGFDGVVHLAGESIAGSRWSARKKRAIRESRVQGTRLLAEALVGLDRPPSVFVGASAAGYYDERGEEVLTEESAVGNGFRAEVAAEWEDAARPVRDAGIRLVHLRFGIVLDPRGGALKEMLLPAKLGLGGPLGSGKQWWSWIAMDDVLELALAALTDTSFSGPYNAVAPEPIRQADFARALGHALSRPSFVPTPAFALRLALGELADALLLSSGRVVPARLLERGHRWRWPELEPALRAMLGSG